MVITRGANGKARSVICTRNCIGIGDGTVIGRINPNRQLADIFCTKLICYAVVKGLCDEAVFIGKRRLKPAIICNPIRNRAVTFINPQLAISSGKCPLV